MVNLVTNAGGSTYGFLNRAEQVWTERLTECASHVAVRVTVRNHVADNGRALSCITEEGRQINEIRPAHLVRRPDQWICHRESFTARSGAVVMGCEADSLNALQGSLRGERVVADHDDLGSPVGDGLPCPCHLLGHLRLILRTFLPSSRRDDDVVSRA